MLNQLLETIIQILTGWLDKFNSHAQHVEDKLDSLDQTASDIETNTDPIPDIRDNTAAVITPIQNIKSNTDSIATSSQTSANNTTAILNNINTLSTNTGRAAAYAEDCANNTLDIKEKITTIASDTTQIRADSGNIQEDVSDIKTYLGYYVANTPVTEDSEGAICNFDTDLEDYLQKLKVNIPADSTGFSGITLTKNGKNLLDKNNVVTGYITPTGFSSGNTNAHTFYCKIKPNTTYTVSHTLSARFIIATAINEPLNSELFTNRQTNNNAEDLTITSGSSDNYLWVFCYLNGTDTKTYDEIANSVMAEIGETATAYEPYKAMTYPVSFGTTITDGAEINLLDGIIKVNSIPVSYQSITPIAVRTNKGVNNIYSNVGTSALTYRETLKHYLDKNNQ